ncbi:magnesium-translocating P-type ATPase [uncultured Clostridium sp.]|jgi:Mg2+-importing ATPase|uniref:magnesium-translocating P-type ATPase n=1 Tax=uncultured Clostridium sp. TaxID=59620 RepID=UPI00261945FB|nr:magnesium-translocating P-type ATPase [uncultured Clostridium sp.]
MKKQKVKKFDQEHFNNINSKIHKNSELSNEKLLTTFKTSLDGLTDSQVKENISTYGKNDTNANKNTPVIVQFIKSFINPFAAVLVIIAIISYLTGVVFVPKSQQSWSQIYIIIFLILTGGIIQFTQEYRSGRAAKALENFVRSVCLVKRNNKAFETIDTKNLVVGDIIKLQVGDMIPADLKILECKDLFISQSTLTGESEPIEKFPLNNSNSTEVGDYTNICLLGTNVVSGTAIAVVIGTGKNTYFGAMQASLQEADTETDFDRSVRQVSKMLLKFMFVMVPLVLVIDWYQTGSFLDSLMFAASLAVGLTPEMLPAIISENLAKGAVKMAKKKTVVKKINSIQNFGSIEILCTDKTGTLTDDHIRVEECIDASGMNSEEVLKYAYINSVSQDGLQNVIDFAIMDRAKEKNIDKEMKDKYKKLDELAFDFTRRRMSVLIEEDNTSKLITKGAFEEMLHISKFIEINGEIVEKNEQIIADLKKKIDRLNLEGMRVIAIAKKTIDKKSANLEDESEMTLIGFLGFLDPPKETTKEALTALDYYGVQVKILTGDNELVTKKVCEQVDFEISGILLGPDIAKMTDEELTVKALKVNVFAKLNPLQKARIVRVLKNADKVVAFMGDGINDSIALKESDVGISVDTAVEIAKESADVILLEKDLMVLKDGIIEGRKVFANATKYLKITASSNYGNSISVLMASIFLPFVPMLPLELLVQNLVYDITQLFIPWDNVDPELIAKPRKWKAREIGKMLIVFGPTNSLFDIITFLTMWFIFGATTMATSHLFQTGWFIEGVSNSIFVLYTLRTEKIPFIQSNPSWIFNLSIVGALLVGWILPYTAIGHAMGMVYITPWYILYIFGLMILLCILTQFVKRLYIRSFKALL